MRDNFIAKPMLTLDEDEIMMMSFEERELWDQHWMSRYVLMCKNRKIPFGTPKEIEDLWLTEYIRPARDCSVDYVPYDLTFYPPWIIDVAKANVIADLSISESIDFERYIEGAQESYLRDAAVNLTKKTGMASLPITLVKLVAAYLEASGLEIIVPPRESREGAWAEATVKALADLPIPAVGMDDITYQVGEIKFAVGIGEPGIAGMTSTSLRLASVHPRWHLFASTGSTVIVLDEGQGSLYGYAKPHQVIESCAVEETVNHYSAARIADLCWAILHGTHLFPVRIKRGYGSAVTDIVAASSSAVSALTATVSAVIQIRNSKRKASIAENQAEADKELISNKVNSPGSRNRKKRKNKKRKRKKARRRSLRLNLSRRTN